MSDPVSKNKIESNGGRHSQVLASTCVHMLKTTIHLCLHVHATHTHAVFKNVTLLMYTRYLLNKMMNSLIYWVFLIIENDLVLYRFPFSGKLLSFKCSVIFTGFYSGREQQSAMMMENDGT